MTSPEQELNTIMTLTHEKLRTLSIKMRTGQVSNEHARQATPLLR